MAGQISSVHYKKSNLARTFQIIMILGALAMVAIGIVQLIGKIDILKKGDNNKRDSGLLIGFGILAFFLGLKL